MKNYQTFRKQYKIFILFLLYPLLGVSQQNAGSFKQILSENNNIINLEATNSFIRIEFCTPKLVRFRFSNTKKFEENEPWMVSRYNWENVSFSKEEHGESLTYTTNKLKVVVNKNPLLITIYNHEGNVLLDEKNEGAFFNNDIVGTNKVLQPDEHFFGFGERMDFLDRRGKKLNLNVGRGTGRPHIVGAYNVLEANYCPIPFFMSTKGYGIFFHNSHPTEWDMGNTSPHYYTFKASGGELDYYFMYGPEFPEILNSYTDITGKSPLLPKFALGLHVGTYSGGTWGHEEKTSTEYVVDLVKKFRDHKIPLDVLHLDSTWRIFGENGGKGATSFEWRETFKDPESMFDSLYALNLNMVGVHLRPRFDNGKKLKLLDQARKKGFVFPEENNKGEFVNFFDDKSANWWWENGVMRVAQQGAMFLKTDEGSAFGHKANESDKTGPQGKEIESLHNLFPIAYAKAPYEKFEQYNKIRGMNHTREGYAGIQRYPFIFAGDWPSEWQYFEPVIKAGLNIGMSGVGNWAHCMGGFEHVADPELYIRWCQFGLLSPVAHLFGMEHPNYKEPWNYGEEALRIFKMYDDLRYSLIPYLYSSSYKMYKTGMPLMQALVLTNQNDRNTYNITDQYMLGENIMVCPVITKEAKTRVVYLPEGKWINYWTHETLEGKQYINVLCPLDQLPIFIKGGAIIPTQETLQYVGEKEISSLNLNIFPMGESSFSLYDDDGKSLGYKNGVFSMTTIESKSSDAGITLKINAPKGKFVVTERSYIVHVRLEKEPISLKVNDKTYKLNSNGEEKNTAIYKEGVLTFTTHYISKKDKDILIKIENSL